MLSSFLKADFVTLTCVCAGLLFVHDATFLQRSTFRQLVALVFLSLVYDIVWFSFYDEELENKIDGNIQPGVRKISILINYFSFMFRVSIYITNIVLDTLIASFVERFARLCTVDQRAERRIS